MGTLIHFLLLSFLTSQADTQLDLMHTTPVCAHANKTPAWCTHDDLIPSADASGMVDKILAQLDSALNPKTAKISIAYFSFSNKPVFSRLCKKAMQGFPIHFFLDSSYRVSPLAISLMHGVCSKEQKIQFDADIAAGKSWRKLKNVHFHFLGKTDVTNPDDITWRLHHNKFLIIDDGVSPNVKINFSSGNLSAYGTSLHFDHWVTATADRQSNLYRTHLCVIEAMKRAVDPDQDGIDAAEDDPLIYRSTLNSCLSAQNTLDPYQALQQEQIAPLFSPNPKNEIANLLINEIRAVQKGQEIIGAIQHFTHTAVANALVSACKQGVPVRMIMDDDVITGESEVPGVGDFYNAYLDKTCIQVRFMQTNAEEAQMMHNKFLILGQRRVFAGAGHFTYSALKENYENFYLMEQPKIHQQYTELFNYMWNMSISKEEVVIPPPPTPNTKP